MKSLGEKEDGLDIDSMIREANEKIDISDKLIQDIHIWQHAPGRGTNPSQ